MANLPPKLFFRIGEVAGLVGVEPHVLRYWEREFRSIRPTKSAKGQRVYSRKDVENLLRVRDLLYRDGFTIAGAKKKLQRGPEDALEEETAIESAPQEEPSSPASARDGEARSAIESTPRSMTNAPPLREQLLALRSEVEDFLAELSGSAGRSRPHASTAPTSSADRAAQTAERGIGGAQPASVKRAGEGP